MLRIQAIIQVRSDSVHDVLPGAVTPLHIACAVDDVDATRLLVGNGAIINAVTESGSTPLHWAAMMNAARVIPVLVEFGANDEMKTNDGLDARSIAERRGSIEAVAALGGGTVEPEEDLPKWVERDDRTGPIEGITEPEKVEEPDPAPVIVPAPATEPKSVPEPKVVQSPVRKPQPEIDQASYKAGQLAFKGGDRARAYEIYSALFSEYPDSEDVNMALGVSAFSLEKFSYASLAFERALMINPYNGRAKLELGRTYLAAGQLGLARDTLGKVLSMNPPKRFRAAAEKMLAAIEAYETRSGIDVRVEVGGLWDDNANVGPSSTSIAIWPQTIGSETFEHLDVSTDSVPIEAIGGFAAANVSGRYDFGKPGKWMLVGDISAYQSFLDKDAEDVQITFFSLSGGMKRVWYRVTTQLRWKYEYIGQGGDGLASVYGANHSLTMNLGAERNWQVVGSAVFEQRDYNAEYDGHDGPYYSGGLSLRRIFGNGRSSVAVGGSYFMEDAEAAIYENSGMELSAALEAGLPWRMTGFAGFGYRTADYEEREVLAPELRTDDQTRITIGLRKLVGEHSRIDLLFRSTSNESTFDLYEYDRNVVSLSVLRAF